MTPIKSMAFEGFTNPTHEDDHMNTHQHSIFAIRTASSDLRSLWSKAAGSGLLLAAASMAALPHTAAAEQFASDHFVANVMMTPQPHSTTRDALVTAAPFHSAADQFVDRVLLVRVDFGGSGGVGDTVTSDDRSTYGPDLRFMLGAMR